MIPAASLHRESTGALIHAPSPCLYIEVIHALYEHKPYLYAMCIKYTFVTLEQLMNLSSIQFVTHAGAIHDVEVGCAGAEPPVSQGSDVVHICLSKPRSVHQNQSPALGSFPQDWDVSVEDVAFTDMLSSILHASLYISTSIKEMKGDRDGKSAKTSATRNSLVQL